MKKLVFLTLLSVYSVAAVQAFPFPSYPWLEQQAKPYNYRQSLEKRIAVPAGYQRVVVEPGSFQEWLRLLPLLEGKPPVMLYNGMERETQASHYAVVDLDIGSQNLQQCADTIMRVWAEYWFSRDRLDPIHFNFTSGDRVDFQRWSQGDRPRVNGNRLSWSNGEPKDGSYRNLRSYLETVYRYAGTYSLSKELTPVPDVSDLRIGDIFIQGGFPGHCVIVVDMAVNPQTGRKIFLLAQGYTPAQSMHILRNPKDETLSPWYDTDFGNILPTVDCVFYKDNLMRFAAGE